MAVISTTGEDIFVNSSSTVDDPLLPWLRSIEKLLNDDLDLSELASDCINTFKSDPRYQNDVRFLKVWFLYMDSSSDYESVFREMEQNKICIFKSSLYESYALFLELKGRLIDAFCIYHLGITRKVVSDTVRKAEPLARKAEPLARLKRAQVLFLERVSDIVNSDSLQKTEPVALPENNDSFINPWLVSTTKDLLQTLKSQLVKYEGYHQSNKPYPGKVALSSLQKSARNKVVEIGGVKYQIKGCAGQGGFAQVFKAYVNSDPGEVVALKIQKPPFPWEFYIYRQLDYRIPKAERSSFGFAHRVHLFADYSILVANYLAHGTLQDAINSNLVTGGSMEEVLCIYYTIEMLHMLETLHDAAIIHGDFKPDNLLIRYARDDLTVDIESFCDHTGPWSDEGLCLVDWGRGIDLTLFHDQTKFMGDSRTSGFRCIEMQEKRPWTFQVDAYGLCVIVHMMLHSSYMEIDRRPSPDGGYTYQPKLPFKRYWQAGLWKDLFSKLLNINPSEDYKNLLQGLRKSFQDYLCSNSQLIKKLKQLLLKQKTSLCSA